jgi:hypothetical protein
LGTNEYHQALHMIVYPPNFDSPSKTHAKAIAAVEEVVTMRLRGVNGDIAIRGHKEQCVFSRLSYYDVVQQRTLDLMHLVPGVLHHVMPMMKGDRHQIGAVKRPGGMNTWTQPDLGNYVRKMCVISTYNI